MWWFQRVWVYHPFPIPARVERKRESARLAFPSFIYTVRATFFPRNLYLLLLQPSQNFRSRTICWSRCSSFFLSPRVILLSFSQTTIRSNMTHTAKPTRSPCGSWFPAKLLYYMYVRILWISGALFFSILTYI